MEHKSRNMSSILGGTFLYIVGSVNKKVKCNICHKEFSYHHSTSSLRYHLTNFHPTAQKSLPTAANDKQQQLTLNSFTRPVTQYRSDRITNAIARWVAMNARPMNIVKDSGFINLLQTAVANSQYKPPSRTSISRKVEGQYEEKEERIKAELKNSEFIALTTGY